MSFNFPIIDVEQMVECIEEEMDRRKKKGHSGNLQVWRSTSKFGP